MATTTEYSDLTVPESGDYRVDALIETGYGSTAAYLNGDAALSGDYTVTYSFDSAYVDTREQYYMTGVTEMSSSQTAWAEDAIEYLEEITGIDFVEVDSGADADLTIVLGNFTSDYQWALGICYDTSTVQSGRSGTSIDIEITIAFNTDYDLDDFSTGTYNYQALLHELGHAVGLKHSFEGGDTLPAKEDNNHNTVMSYTSTTPYESTYQEYDLLALDYLYGGDGLGGASGYTDDPPNDGGGDDGAGSNGALQLNGGSYTLTDHAVATVTGSSSGDHLTLDNNGWSLLVSAVESITGGSKGDWITLGGKGGTVTLSSVESVTGSTGSDAVTLGTGGTVTVTAVETVTGSKNADQVKLDGTLTVAGVETISGGAGTDFVTLGSSGASSGSRGAKAATTQTVTVVSVDILLGSSGNDVVSLGSAGTVTMAAVETLIGSTGSDFLMLGNRGNTTSLGAVEILLGGTGKDRVSMTAAGTLTMAAVETLTGSNGADSVLLGNRGNTVTIANVESIAGGTGIDSVTVSSGGVRFEGGAGADTISLASGGDKIVFSSGSDGGVGGDTVKSFATNADDVVIANSLATAVDDDGNGVLAAATRAGGTVDLSTDEAVALSTKVTSLTDDGFASFRSALGNVTGSGDCLVLANDGTSTGLYLIEENGDGTVSAGEVTLLAVFKSAKLTTSDLVLSA